MSRMVKASVIIVILAMITNIAYQCIYGFTPKRIILLAGMLIYVVLVSIIAKLEKDDDKEE